MPRVKVPEKYETQITTWAHTGHPLKKNTLVINPVLFWKKWNSLIRKQIWRSGAGLPCLNCVLKVRRGSNDSTVRWTSPQKLCPLGHHLNDAAPWLVTPNWLMISVAICWLIDCYNGYWQPVFDGFFMAITDVNNAYLYLSINDSTSTSPTHQNYNWFVGKNGYGHLHMRCFNRQFIGLSVICYWMGCHFHWSNWYLYVYFMLFPTSKVSTSFKLNHPRLYKLFKVPQDWPGWTREKWLNVCSPFGVCSWRALGRWSAVPHNSETEPQGVLPWFDCQ